MLTEEKTEEINKFLKKYFNIKGTYTISEDGVVDVYGDITLLYQKFNKDGFTELPIQFGNITGDFDFRSSNILNSNGFPQTVGRYFSIDGSLKLKFLSTSKSNEFYCHGCKKLESLNGLNCERFYGDDLNLKRIGTNFSAKSFSFMEFPTPTADEMRRFINLNSVFYTIQEAPWITLINDYHKHKDIFRTAQEFEELYGETLVKPEDKIEIIQSNNDILSF